MKLLFTLIFAFSVTVNAQQAKPKDTGAPGAGEGNGGVLVRQNQQLKTLAEVGVMLQRASNMADTANKYAPYYSVSSDTVDEVRKILSLLPVSENKHWVDAIVQRGRLLRVDDVDAAEYKKISADYAAVMKKFSQTFDPSLFVLGAVTKDKKTNILPAFHHLDSRQQALILIHEYCFRNPTEKLKKNPFKHLGLILELDTQIYKLIQANEKQQTLDPMLTLAIMEDLGLISDYTRTDLVAYHAIKILQEKANRGLLIEDFVLEDDTRYSAQEIDPHLVRELNQFDKRAVQIFESAKFIQFSHVGAGGAKVKFSDEEHILIGNFCKEKFPQGSGGNAIFAANFRVYTVRCGPDIHGNGGIPFMDLLEFQDVKAVY